MPAMTFRDHIAAELEKLWPVYEKRIGRTLDISAGDVATDLAKPLSYRIGYGWIEESPCVLPDPSRQRNEMGAAK